MKKASDPTEPHRRRARYPGRNPRRFHEKYKELNPDQYPAQADKVIASGKTPAGTHRPIMVEEVLAHLRPTPGEVAVDCTLGGGGHALAILERVQPGGRVIGLDVDPIEIARTEARLRAAGFGPDTFVTHHGNFAGLPQVLAAQGLRAADMILADLGVSSMQLDNPDRGFSYKASGPLDLRMNPSKGESAAQLLMRASEGALAGMLQDHAEEPHAHLIAALLKRQPLETTEALNAVVRAGLSAAVPQIGEPDLSLSVRRTFQALRVAVNDEFGALDWLLRVLPECLTPGGRLLMLTFHSGEDRRVKKAFQEGQRTGVYSAVANEIIRPAAKEIGANRRASSAKLRWAVRSPDLEPPRR